MIPNSIGQQIKHTHAQCYIIVMAAGLSRALYEILDNMPISTFKKGPRTSREVPGQNGLCPGTKGPGT